MTKKMLSLILMILLLSGCSATYNLNINGDEYTEDLEMNTSSVSSLNSNIYIPINHDNYSDDNITTKIDNIDYYTISKDDTTTKISATMSLDEYQNSTIVLKNFSNFNIKNEDSTIIINSGTEDYAFMKYPNLDNLTINITTNHNVISNNADEIKDNTYTWNITKDNYKNKTIQLKMSESFETELFSTDDDGYFGTNTLIAIYIVIGIFLIIGCGFIYLKVKKSNR